MARTRLGYVAEVQRKILKGKPVSIGVFCSGNGDRSPFAQAVLEKTFRDIEYYNVRVFSFGTSVSPNRHHGPASARTFRHAKEMGYDLSGHKRRHISDADVQQDIKKADLLLAISPSHAALAAEYSADEAPNALKDILKKTWTLKGFANRSEWTLPFRGRLARGLALKDPYFHPETLAGERKFRADLIAVGNAALKAFRRLII